MDERQYIIDNLPRLSPENHAEILRTVFIRSGCDEPKQCGKNVVVNLDRLDKKIIHALYSNVEHYMQNN